MAKKPQFKKPEPVTTIYPAEQPGVVGAEPEDAIPEAPTPEATVVEPQPVTPPPAPKLGYNHDKMRTQCVCGGTQLALTNTFFKETDIVGPDGKKLVKKSAREFTCGDCKTKYTVEV